MSNNIPNLQINDLRLSFIWTQTALDFLKGTNSPTCPNDISRK